MTQREVHEHDSRDRADAEGGSDTTVHTFDKAYWEQHWQYRQTGAPGSMVGHPPNPYLIHETGDLTPGTALDAGCGAGAEAIWLAAAGWQVTAVDISHAALVHAAGRAAVESSPDASERIQWVAADLLTWQPDTRFDLVTSHYAHAAMPQLDFYERIAAWVKPGGTLLIVGHHHLPDVTDHADAPPAEASVTASTIAARLEPAAWQIVTADECVREMPGGGQMVTLHDVVVRATRRS